MGIIVYFADTANNHTNIPSWIQKLGGGANNIGTNLIEFPLMLLSSLALPVYVFYAGAGLVLLPVMFIKRGENEAKDIRNSLISAEMTKE